MLDWLTPLKDFAGPIATVIASGVAAYFAAAQGCIARTQSEIALDKLRLDLFEKKYGIYREVGLLLEYLLTHSTFKGQDLTIISTHRARIEESRFFFGQNIRSLLLNIDNECTAYIALLTQREGCKDDREKWGALGEELTAKRAFFHKTLLALPAAFEKELSFLRAAAD